MKRNFPKFGGDTVSTKQTLQSRVLKALNLLTCKTLHVDDVCELIGLKANFPASRTRVYRALGRLRKQGAVQRAKFTDVRDGVSVKTPSLCYFMAV